MPDNIAAPGSENAEDEVESHTSAVAHAGKDKPVMNCQS